MKKIESKNLYLLIIAFFLLISSAAIAQKKINKLTNYNGKDYWVVEKNGLKGLKSGNGKQIVPAAYDLVLPSLLSDFSFIAQNGKLGLYDNVTQQELVLEKEFDKVSLFVDVDNKLILNFYNPYDYNNREDIYVLNRGSNRAIIIQKEEKYQYHKPKERREENGLERVDSVYFIHHFSHVGFFEKDNTIQEESPNVNLEASIQKTGVYSLESNDFVVAPEFISISHLFEEDYFESMFYYDYYNAIQLDKATIIESSQNNKQTNSWSDLYIVGLYNKAFKLLVAPQKKTIYPLSNNWYYLPTTNDSLTIYDNQGNRALQLANLPDAVVSLDLIGNRFYLATETDDEWDVNMEMRTEFYTYHIYDEQGEFIKTEKFSIGTSTKKNNVSVVLVQKLDNEWDFLYGTYDFGKSEFVIPPIYNSFRKQFFSDDIITCKPDNCSYYFELEKGENYRYFDQHLEPFIPERAISKDIYEQYRKFNHTFYPNDLSYYTEITEVDANDQAYSLFSKKGIAITHELYEYELMLLDDYAGFVFTTFDKFEILAMYDIYEFKNSEEKQHPSYALIDKERNRLLLPPFFSKMNFNAEKSKLEFTYQGESGSILLERYDKD